MKKKNAILPCVRVKTMLDDTKILSTLLQSSRLYKLLHEEFLTITQRQESKTDKLFHPRLFYDTFDMMRHLLIVDPETYLPLEEKIIGNISRLFASSGDREASKAFFQKCYAITADFKNFDRKMSDPFFEQIKREFLVRYSYAQRTTCRKNSYCYATTVTCRYRSFDTFCDTMIRAKVLGAKEFRSLPIYDVFGCESIISLDENYYYFKIANTTATSVMMTIDSTFDQTVERLKKSDLSKRMYYIFRSVEGDGEENGQEQCFLMIDKAAWLCVHSSWLCYMDSSLPYHRLLMKHWFFQSYDPLYDRLRKKNVLSTLLRWINPKHPGAKRYIMDADEDVFDKYYDTLFKIINKFKENADPVSDGKNKENDDNAEQPWKYKHLEDQVKKSFLHYEDKEKDKTSCHNPSLLKAVRDMILYNREHAVEKDTAHEMLDLFDRNVLDQDEFPIAFAVLNDLVRRKKYAHQIEKNDTEWPEHYRITSTIDFSTVDFTKELGPDYKPRRLKDRLNALSSEKSHRCRSRSDISFSSVDSSDMDVSSTMDSSSSSSSIYGGDSTGSFSSMATGTFSSSSSSSSMDDDSEDLRESNVIPTETIAREEKEQVEDTTIVSPTAPRLESARVEKNSRRRAKAKAARAIVQREKKAKKKLHGLALLSLYLLCASPKLDACHAQKLFQSIVIVSSRNVTRSLRRTKTLLVSDKKGIKEAYNNDDLIFQPDIFDAVPLQRRSKCQPWKKKTATVKKMTNPSKFMKESIDVEGTMSSFLWTDASLAKEIDESTGKPARLFVKVESEYADILTTTEIFLRLTEKLALISAHEKDAFIRRDNILNLTYNKIAMENVKPISPSRSTTTFVDEIFSSLEVISPQKNNLVEENELSKLVSHANAKPNDRRMFSVLSPNSTQNVVKKKERKKSTVKVISADEMILIFRNKQLSPSIYDYVLDSCFLENAQKVYLEFKFPFSNFETLPVKTYCIMPQTTLKDPTSLITPTTTPITSTAQKMDQNNKNKWKFYAPPVKNKLSSTETKTRRTTKRNLSSREFKIHEIIEPNAKRRKITSETPHTPVFTNKQNHVSLNPGTLYKFSMARPLQ